MATITRAMLRDYLSDALPDAELTAVEAALRTQPAVQQLMLAVREEIDRGEHSLGGIWRRERLSCPSREQMGSYLLQSLDDDLLDYIKFHLETIGCPICQANYDDLQKKKASANAIKRRQTIASHTSGALQKAARR